MKLGLLRAYRTVGVNPDRYLKHLRRAYGLHTTSFHEMKTVPLPVVDYLSDKTNRTSTKIAMLNGAGAGVGGITWRMIQKLSLLHGFEYASEDDMADLWLAAASGASRSWIGRLVPHAQLPGNLFHSPATLVRRRQHERMRARSTCRRALYRCSAGWGSTSSCCRTSTVTGTSRT